MKLMDLTPVACKIYPFLNAKTEPLWYEIESLFSAGIISPSEFPYNAGVIRLRKPSGEHQLYIDYRLLNAITPFQPQPLLHPNKLSAKLATARYFSRTDLSKGYY